MNEERMRELPETLGTPAYVFDADVLRERLCFVAETIRPARLCFAVKANPFLLPVMDEEVERYEVCSPGELHICRKDGIDPEKIVLSGVSKEYEDVRFAMEWGVVHYTAESKRQFALLGRCARELGKTVDILLRVTSGCQFGMSEADVRELIRARASYPELHVAGLQYFTGTQKKSIPKIAGEVSYIEDFMARLLKEEGYRAEVLEFGPGLGVPYFTKDDFGADEALLREFMELFREERPYELIFEMGRYLTASCGYYMTKIMDQKRNDAVNACIVDGGIHHVKYYGQNMAMKTPIVSHVSQHESAQETEEEWTVYGSLCTVSDILLKKFPMRDAQVGDCLVFQNTGAYSVTEGISLFLSRRLPRVYLYSEKAGAELLRDALESYVWNTSQG